MPWKKNKIVIISYLLIGGIISSVVLVTDRILLTKAVNGKIGANMRATMQTEIQDKDWRLKNSHYGPLIKEGGFTNKAIFENRHHDDPDYFFEAPNATRSIWIFGDSWGAGLKHNEKLNKTIETARNGSTSIRITGVVSYSPLLMLLAYRDRLKALDKHPDEIAIFIDQTDIGDDWCRYRPYVIRDHEGKLAGVTRNNLLNLSGGTALVSYYKILGNIRSGIAYAITSRAHLLSTQSMELPGISGCSYNDLLTFQRGLKHSDNGSPTKDQLEYFKDNLKAFIQEIKTNQQTARIKLISHDWAQHNLKEDDKDYMPNNISTVLQEVASETPNTTHLHVGYKSHYAKKSLKDVFQFPSDRFSHLKSYSRLADIIQAQFNS